MKPFTKRRIRHLLAAALTTVAIGYWLRWVAVGLGRDTFASGYLLYGLVVFLTAFNLRKKLPMLPLGSAVMWLQLHLYSGVVAGVVFGLHLGWRLPNGWFEAALATAFMMTFMSGVVGIVVTRTTPKVLSRVSEEVVFERIPQLRRHLFDSSRSVVLDSVSTTGSTTLADFYQAQLFDFFAGPRPVGYFFRPTSRRRKRLLSAMSDLNRYLTDAERSACERLFSLVRKKDDLDFHEARQRLLKLWLFGHISLTYLLIVLATVHGVLALAFRGDGL